MCKRITLSIFLAIALLTAVTWAVPIEVENFSFELPNTGKRMGFATIPGWSTDSAASGSGVETGAQPTDGDYTAFLMGTDPLIWQLTDHTIIRGDIFELKVDARDAGGSTSLFMSLYYEDNGTRITVASSDVEITDAMGECILQFNSADAPDSARHLLGIELGNITAGPGNWVGVDNIRLDLIKAGTPVLASQPSPANEQVEVPVDTILNWTPGEFADKHDVYFSTNFDNVNDGVALVSPSQDANSYDPGRLDFAQTYFWRVDEVNAPPDLTVFKGDVWSFTVEPLACLISADRITATASSQAAGQEPENTINESGLVDDLHSTQTKDMWATVEGEALPAWIQYEFDKTYQLHEMLVWNYNGQAFLVGLGLQSVVVEYSTDGTNWTQVENASVFEQASGLSDYTYNTKVAFGDAPVRYVKITANSNWGGGGFFNQYGLSEVRFMHIPVGARQPEPDDGAADVAIDVTLGWRAGREAAEHNVYFSADQQAVIDGTALVDTVSQASYGPLSLDLASTYYWRVDEVNNANTIPIWEGSVWSFTTRDYLVVDDFESYNDIEQGDESNLVYATWSDGGYGPTNDPTNGSTIGYLSAPSMETEIVHGGRQSVPVMYDNTAANKSEVTVNPADLAIGSDWTIGGSPEMLSLWIYGDPNNSAEQMYVKLNGEKVPYDADLTQEEWQQFPIDLASLGINLSNVTSVTIGFERIGATGGTGMVFIDDIWLYSPVATQ